MAQLWGHGEGPSEISQMHLGRTAGTGAWGGQAEQDARAFRGGVR